jgi:hypothetical protein
MIMHDDAAIQTDTTSSRPLSASEAGRIKQRSTPTKNKPDITLSDIAHEMQMTPRDARARLRAAHIKHGAQGWRWKVGDPQLIVIRRILA